MRLTRCYFFVVSLDDEDDDVPLPVLPEDVAPDEEPVPDVPVPVVPVEPVPDVEPALLLVPLPPMPLVPDVLPVPLPVVLPALLPVVPDALPVVPDALPVVLSVLLPVVPVDDDDDDTGGGAGGVTTVVDELAPGVVVEPVAGGESWRCWHAPSASSTLAATAVRIGRFIVAPGSFCEGGEISRTCTPRARPWTMALPRFFSRIGATRRRRCALRALPRNAIGQAANRSVHG